jgi:hypothetical protein
MHTAWTPGAGGGSGWTGAGGSQPWTRRGAIVLWSQNRLKLSMLHPPMMPIVPELNLALENILETLGASGGLQLQEVHPHYRRGGAAAISGEL